MKKEEYDLSSNYAPQPYIRLNDMLSLLYPFLFPTTMVSTITSLSLTK